MDNLGFPFMTREVRTHQRGAVLMMATVDGSAVAGGTAVTTGLDTGAAAHMTITENGDGDYTLILSNPGVRFLGLFATSITDAANVTCALATDGTSCRVKQITASTGAALADSDFSLMMMVGHAQDHT